MRNKDANMGTVINMEAVNATENVGGNYIDGDNFYPADGINEYDAKSWDISYDNSINDLSQSSDYFDGDTDNSYFNNEYTSCFDGDDDGFSGLDGVDESWSNGSGSADRKAKREAAKEERKTKRDDAAEERKTKSEDRKTERGERKEERKIKSEDRKTERGERKDKRIELRQDKKSAKTDEIKARSALTNSMAVPDNSSELLKSLTNDPSGNELKDDKKGMSTMTIILISVGGLLVLGTAAFFLLRKKK